MQIGLLQFQDLLYLSNVKHVLDFHKYNMYAGKAKDMTSTSCYSVFSTYLQLQLHCPVRFLKFQFLARHRRGAAARIFQSIIQGSG